MLFLRSIIPEFSGDRACLCLFCEAWCITMYRMLKWFISRLIYNFLYRMCLFYVYLVENLIMKLASVFNPIENIECNMPLFYIFPTWHFVNLKRKGEFFLNWTLPLWYWMSLWHVFANNESKILQNKTSVVWNPTCQVEQMCQIHNYWSSILIHFALRNRTK